jgi:uncharacterized protein YkwD
MGNKNKYINKNLITLSFVLLVIFFLTFTFLKVNVRSANITENNIIFQINKIRRANGLTELRTNKILQLASRNKAADIKIFKYFSHNSPHNLKWNDFLSNVGYQYSIAGENLAKGYYAPEEVINDWMKSPTHKENILLADYTETGVSVIETDNMGIVVVQLFAKPIQLKK